MQVIGGGNRQDVQVGIIPYNILPGSLSVINGEIHSQLPKFITACPAGSLAARAQSDKPNAYAFQRFGQKIQPEAAQPGNQSILFQLAVGAQMDVPAEHTRTDQCYFQFFFHMPAFSSAKEEQH
ncbi:MAG: hypothetical protein BWX80_03154 [Candidatus Hydrogenedentes bacterium ADurb.Bin101]|nr:MAG: hypothetical protein BWX80_03154 [Candidatus Hydrogenedentes bacterium ADurb.Bin101]